MSTILEALSVNSNLSPNYKCWAFLDCNTEVTESFTFNPFPEMGKSHTYGIYRFGCKNPYVWDFKKINSTFCRYCIYLHFHVFFSYK